MSVGWKVLDSVSDGPKDVFEDRIGCLGNYVWVMDGSTPLTETPLTHAASDAAWLVDIIHTELERCAEQGDARPLSKVVSSAITAARDASAEWLAEPIVAPSAALALARLDGAAFDYFLLGDITLATESVTICDSRVEDFNATARDQLTAALEDGESFESARASIQDELRLAREHHMNVAGGYWIISIDERASANALEGRLETAPGRPMLLASDGLSRFVDTFMIEPDWETALSGAKSLQEALALVREAEDKDPEARAFPRWSLSDDAAGILVAPE